MIGNISILVKKTRTLEQEYGREPNVEEIAEELGWTQEKVVEFMGYLRKDEPLEEELESGTERQELIADENAEDVESDVDRLIIVNGVQSLLNTLSPQSREVLRRRFGMIPYKEKSKLDKVAQEMKIKKDTVKIHQMLGMRKLGGNKEAKELWKSLED